MEVDNLNVVGRTAEQIEDAPQFSAAQSVDIPLRPS